MWCTPLDTRFSNQRLPGAILRCEQFPFDADPIGREKVTRLQFKEPWIFGREPMLRELYEGLVRDDEMLSTECGQDVPALVEAREPKRQDLVFVRVLVERLLVKCWGELHG